MLLLATFWLLWTLQAWYRLHPHIPWRDLFVLLGQRDELTSLEAWLQPHFGAHRIALPRLLLLLDVEWGAGMNHWFFGAALLAGLALLGVIATVSWPYFPDRSSWLFVCALAVALLCSPAHIWNLSNPINVSWIISLALSLSALAVIVCAASPLTPGRWLLAFALVIAAAFCTFTGVIACLLLPLLALVIDRRRAPWVLLFTVVFTAWYVQGMTSDAAIATGWNQGSPELIEEVRDQARHLLAANTMWRIAEKSLQYLTWPLASDFPIAALCLAFFSVLCLALCLVPIWRQYQANGTYEPWLVFCLLVVLLCLGVAVATQLGRVMVHPNYAHGPSYERYQSVVLLYWMGFCGLLTGLARYSSLWRQNLCWFLLLVLVCLLQYPQGRYLAQESASFEYAAWLFSVGEAEVQNGQSPRAGNRFIPEYIFNFDDIFAAKGLTYHQPITLTPAHGVEPSCGGSWNIQVGDPVFRRRVKVVRYTPDLALGYWTRSLRLMAGEQLLVRMNPRWGEQPTALELAGEPALGWSGPLRDYDPIGSALSTGELTGKLVAELPWADRVICQVQLDRFAATP